MRSNRKIRTHLISWILCVIFIMLGSILVFHFFSLSRSSHQFFSKHLQKVVYQQDNELHQAQTDLLYSFDQLNYSTGFTSLSYQLPSSVGVYVFYKDSLVYWNSNLIEPKLLRKRVDLGNDTIINLNIGDFLITSDDYGAYSFYLFSLLNTTYPIENEYFVNKLQPMFGKHNVTFSGVQTDDCCPVYSRSGKLLSYCNISFPSTWNSSNLAFLIVCACLMLLCAYLLVARYFTSSLHQKSFAWLRKKPILTLVLLSIVVLALSFIAFREIFRYGFTQGFLIPSAMRMDYCFLALFVGLLFIVTYSMMVRWLLKPLMQKRNEFLVIVAQFVLWGIMLTVLYNKEYTRFENNQIRTLAEELSFERDQDFEQSYQQFLFDVQHDSTFNAMAFSDNIMEEVLVDYMRSFLLDSVMSQYNVASAICSPDQELVVQPYDILTDCNAYFNDKIQENHGVSLGDGLYYVDYNSLDPNYMAIFTIESDDDPLSQRMLYLEFTKPVTPRGFGLSKMLQHDHNALLLRSSVACYRDSLLVYKYGSYIYPNYLADFKHPVNEFSYGRKLKHYVYQVEDSNKVLAISTDRRTWMEMTAPFVVFFFFLLVLYLLVYFVGGVMRSNPSARNLSSRFQMLVLVALGISFLLVGPISVIYLRSLYTQKANETHFDRTRTLSLDITGEVDFSFMKQPGFKPMLDDVLRRYSETFFTDINVYDVNGKLFATTTPEIIELQLQSSLMNAEAYHNLQGEKALYYIHNEKVGNAVYQSSYIAIQDIGGKTLAYLNLPYFSSQSDLETEILYYVLTYINIILLIIFGFLPVVLIITRRVTDPLVRLQEKMRLVDINKSNEKLEWKSKDEIGALIDQYNQLIEELEKSAAELKRTTTESAWRGVARQVAHEIKNSLTPMRLSVQMLQHNIENGQVTPEQMQRTANTLIEQIDALSDIASSFSRYAKLPENHPQPLDLAELVGNVVNLYNNIESITFNYQVEPETDFTFNGDKTNLNSAVGNLVKNAVQAIGNKPDGKIDVTLQSTKESFVIAVKDNGKGIKEEDKKMIFVPNFTTKTGGSGVGLSLTYNIVQLAGGAISFESQEGEGAKFTIKLPRVK